MYTQPPPPIPRFGSVYTVDANRNTHFWVLILIHSCRRNTSTVTTSINRSFSVFPYTLESSLSSYGIAHLAQAAKSQATSAAGSSTFLKHPCVAQPYSRKACCSHLRCCEASQQDPSLSEHQYYFESINISSSVSGSSSWRNLKERLRYCQDFCSWGYGIRSRNKCNLRFGAFRYCKSPQEEVCGCECMSPSGSTSMLQKWSLGTAGMISSSSAWLDNPETATALVILVDHKS